MSLVVVLVKTVRVVVLKVEIIVSSKLIDDDK